MKEEEEETKMAEGGGREGEKVGLAKREGRGGEERKEEMRGKGEEEEEEGLPLYYVRYLSILLGL